MLTVAARGDLAMQLGAIDAPVGLGNLRDVARQRLERGGECVGVVAASGASRQMGGDALALVGAQFTAHIGRDLGLWMSLEHRLSRPYSFFRMVFLRCASAR